MISFEKIFSDRRTCINKKRGIIKSVRKNFEDYSRRNISIFECLPKSGALTADLAIYHNIEIKLQDNAYDIILTVAINYYAMLYMDIYPAYYTVNKKHTFQQVFSLVEGVLLKTGKDRGWAEGDLDDAIYTSRDLSKQAVDIFYRAGAEGCKKLLAASIYAVLMTENRYQTVDRIQIENIIRALCVRKYLKNSFSGIYSGS